MANKTVFASTRGKLAPPTTGVNEAGGRAYMFNARHALAQYVCTGTFNQTFYASADEQVAKVLELAKQVDPSFLAKLAVYARERGRMKDMPALLCAVLAASKSATNPAYDLHLEFLSKIFPRVIDNARMLRNFVQIIRSGVTGRKSLGTRPKKLIQKWFADRTDDQLFHASVGNSPSLGDVIRLARPAPDSYTRRALYAYLMGKQSMVTFTDDGKIEEPMEPFLPNAVLAYERFKAEGGELPDVPMEMLTGLPGLSPENWIGIAYRMSWTQTRMNLNTLLRHGVFSHPRATKAPTEIISERLRDPERIRRAQPFPYQLLAAFLNIEDAMPQLIKLALQDALELAVQNVPAVQGAVFLFPDVSGSMSSPITGERKGSTSKVRCIDVAALVSAVFLRRNPQAVVLPFHNNVVGINLNPRDSIMTNAQKLGSIGGGGTNCSAPLAFLNRERMDGDLCIFISDNQSWMDPAAIGTATMTQWNGFRARNPKAKLVCIDVQPYAHTQAKEREDILNIGGFSDSVFDVVAKFAAEGLGSQHWVEVIEAVEL